ncbi:hypothetical protein [Streptomyces sp. NPDC002566]|uniref:hypothetical protein n=1 Tax=Streptomyces sp. NPDC002566 TaxID=3364650 RepID=UPI0036B3FDD2
MLLAAPIVSIVAARAAVPVHMDDGAALPDAEHDIVDRHDDTGCQYDNTTREGAVVIRPGNATGLPDGCWWVVP